MNGDHDTAPFGRISMRPPRWHATWGINGVMFGMALRVNQANGRTVGIIDPEYAYLRRRARSYGHNGLRVGQWFPRQLVALFHGCHGLPQGGVHFNRRTGAYSIVRSGQYNGLDVDNGNTILYAAPGSMDNRQGSPLPSTAAADGLWASIASRRPVRVLRASSLASPNAPRVGLRYDGLYRVVGVETRSNAQGGLYERFILRRLRRQPSLNECLARPNAAERLAFRRINDLF